MDSATDCAGREDCLVDALFTVGVVPPDVGDARDER
jgi:hypothetical protein